MPVNLVEASSDFQIVKITGRWNSNDNIEFNTHMKSVIDRKDKLAKVIVDLSHLELIDSQGLGTLVYHYISMKREGIKFLIVAGTNPNSYVNSLFETTNLNKVLDFISTLK